MRNGGVAPLHVYENVSLSNEEDDLLLLVEDLVVDRVQWDDGRTMPDPDGASLSLDAFAPSSADNDDPTRWCSAPLAWSDAADRGSPGRPNAACWPVADARVAPVSHYTCNALRVDGTGSYDPNGTELSYAWRLVSVPDTSALVPGDLVGGRAPTAVVVPDAAGAYTFLLEACTPAACSSDELVATVTERPYNSAPTANAGPDLVGNADSCCRSSSGNWICGTCWDVHLPLNGSASTDPDGDQLGYDWEMTGGLAFSPTLADEDQVVAELVVGGSSAGVYGATSYRVVEATLTVTDCAGATDSDSVSITYACEGVQLGTTSTCDD
jgi:hypothetical protein